MPDVFNIAVSALNAFQKALAVTGNNIANSSTPGYSRQVVDLTTRPPEGSSSGFVGNGVDVTSVSRVVDLFANQQARSANTLLSQQNSYLTIANQVDNLVGGSTNSVAASLTSFFNSWQTLASDPTSSSNRQLVLTQAQTLAGVIKQTSQQLTSLQQNTNAQIQTTVTQINTLTDGIAKLNDTITKAMASAGGQPPNDLLDQRDALINQLAKLTNVQTNQEKGGAIDIYVGNGEALVVGAAATQLATRSNPFDGSKLDVTYGSGASAPVLTTWLNSGSLGGLLQVGSQLIDPTQAWLGQIATGLAAAVNGQQAQGLDQNGQLGKPIFAVGAPTVLPNVANQGSGTVAASVTSVAALGTDNYRLNWDGTNWTAIDASTGQAVTLTGTGTSASPFQLPGMSVVVGGSPTAGDSFLIEPTTNAATSLSVVMTDTRGVAAAAPITASAAASNVSNATIGSAQVLNAANANLLASAAIVFQSPTTYTVNGGAVQTLASGGAIQANGWQVQITGTPAAGDTFNVVANTAGLGDNSNALLMAQLQTGGVLNGGTASLAASYASLVATVGTQVQSVTQSQTAQQAIVTQAQQLVSSASGVNLDEEAANLLQWQNAYSAAAKLVGVADTMFQTLLTAVRTA